MFILFIYLFVVVVFVVVFLVVVFCFLLLLFVVFFWSGGVLVWFLKVRYAVVVCFYGGLRLLGLCVFLCVCFVCICCCFSGMLLCCFRAWLLVILFSGGEFVTFY